MPTIDERDTAASPGTTGSQLAEALHECLGDWLGPRLSALFARLDDTLFANAVGAATREEQDGWFLAMQTLRSSRGAFGSRLRESLRATGRSRAVKVLGADADAEYLAWQSAFATAATRAAEQHAGALKGLRELVSAWSVREPQAAATTIDAQRLAAGLARTAFAQRIPPLARGALVSACEEGLFRELDAYLTQCASLLLEAGISAHEEVDASACDEAAVRTLLPGMQGVERSRRLVQLLFRELSGDVALVPRVRALLAGLEPVVLAAASAEHEFFAAREHPLRAALSDLGVLALGIGPREAVDSDPQFTALAGFARELRLAGADRSAVQRVAARIARYAAEQARQARLAQQRCEIAEQARVLAATAHAAIERELARELGHCRLPSAAEELLREGWRRVLVHAQLEGGVDGAPWQRMLGGLRVFIALWRRGAACIPEELADQLAEAMLRAGCDPLRGEILLRSADEELASWDPPAPPPALMQVEEPPDAPSEAEAEALARATLAEVDALGRGAWIVFTDDAGIERCRARLALRCGEPQHLLFVDRYGQRALCMQREEFAAVFASGRACRLATGGDPLARALARLHDRLGRRAHAA